MARRISRRPRVVWLPMDRSNRLGAAGDASIGTQHSFMGASLNVPGGTGSTVTETFAVVADNPTDIALTGGINTLSDVEQSSYRLRRIVGKIFVHCFQIDDQILPLSVIVTIGFIILRVNPQGAPLARAIDPGGYSTVSLDNNPDPWIWRRSWRLGNGPLALSTTGAAFWPETNASLSSALDGPHIDAKTARIVGPEERLFMVATGTGIEGNSQGVLQVDIVTDLRVLASMRNNVGNRRNASR